MADRHRHSQLQFRPPGDLREWLLAHAAETGRPLGAILTDAAETYRQRVEEGAERRDVSAGR